jgi:hypothetical protein
MRIKELEEKVWDQDRIRIVIRNSSTANVKAYMHRNAAQENWSVSKFIQSRIQNLLGDETEIVVLSGDGKQPHGRTLLKTIRESYN